MFTGKAELWSIHLRMSPECKEIQPNELLTYSFPAIVNLRKNAATYANFSKKTKPKKGRNNGATGKKIEDRRKEKEFEKNYEFRRGGRLLPLYPLLYYP
uniref:Uncharacterized protein n=1 Tax=Romanomermis culicivorax TaxID=13658 RepID=A0A915JZ23_ROMCU